MTTAANGFRKPNLAGIVESMSWHGVPDPFSRNGNDVLTSSKSLDRLTVQSAWLWYLAKTVTRWRKRPKRVLIALDAPKGHPSTKVKKLRPRDLRRSCRARSRTAERHECFRGYLTAAHRQERLNEATSYVRVSWVRSSEARHLR